MPNLVRKTIFLALLLAAGYPMTGSADLRELRLNVDPERVRWTQMKMTAQKFIFSASTEAKLAFVDSPSLADVIIPTDQGNPVMPGDTVASLGAVTKYFGKESRIQYHMFPDSAQAIQYALDEDGDRTKHRIYRYTDTGIFVRTHRPGNRDQRKDPWPTWPTIQTEWRTIAEAAYGAPIVEPLGLLYLTGAADIGPGIPPVELLSISDRKVVRVRLSGLDASPRKVNYKLSAPNGSWQCKGEVPAIRIAVDGEPVEPQEDVKFQFLGLEEEIEIFVEPESRVVLEVRGKAPIVGNLVTRLKEATLDEPGGCPTV
ncbi:MAG: hypothetical protein QNJ73_11185 [Gammaproteobacteria bacterium]|nr:hypothetical protein [Gammaproteobacteria bacterium]